MKHVQEYMLFVGAFFLSLLIFFQIEADDNKQSSYIYLNDSVHNIAEYIHAVSSIDDTVDSPINKLEHYISDGGKAALCKDIVLVLHYAQDLLMQKYSVDNQASYKNLICTADSLVEVIDEGLLTLHSHVINKKNNSSFMIDAMQIDDSGLTESAVRLNVIDNITMVDSVLSESQSIGNIIKGGNLFINNYGTDNTFVGKFAGSKGSTTSNNTAIGYNALIQNNQGLRNTAVGSNVLNSENLNNQNVAIGAGAMQTVLAGISENDVVIGHNSFINMNNKSSFNVIAGEHSAIFKTNSSFSKSDINYNVVLGTLAVQANPPGAPTSAFFNFNVFVGTSAGFLRDQTNSNNICIGSKAGVLSRLQSNIYIGNPGVTDPEKGDVETNTIRIGKPFDVASSSGQTRCFIAGIRRIQTGRGDAISVVIDSDGQLGTIVSSRRFKDNIQPMNKESGIIYNLNPVSFVYKNDNTAAKQYGLIAEEVNEYSPDLVVKDNGGTPYAVRYEVLPVLLLNELKKHQNDIKQQEHIAQEQRATMRKQKHTIKEQRVIMLQHNNEIQKQEQDIQQHSCEIDTLLAVVSKLQEKVQSFIANNN